MLTWNLACHHDAHFDVLLSLLINLTINYTHADHIKYQG